MSWQPPEQLLTAQQNNFYTRVLQGRNRSIKALLVTDDDDDDDDYDDDGITTIVRLSSDRPLLYRHPDKSVWLCDKLNQNILFPARTLHSREQNSSYLKGEQRQEQRGVLLGGEGKATNLWFCETELARISL
jgi:hypothetical protein